MPHKDLREWMMHAQQLDELRRVNGVHWDMEMSALSEMVARNKKETRWALLCDEIVGYPKGYRVLLDPLATLPRVAMTLDFDPGIERTEFSYKLREKINSLPSLAPEIVSDGPVLQNIREGKDIDMFSLPAPKYHTQDGGRYIGTGSVTVTRDPESGWVNLGTYRIMIHDEKTLSFHVSPSHHARIHRDQLFARGESMRVAVSFGHDPLLLLAGSASLPYGVSEYNWAGGVRGEPIEVIQAPHTGLPIPATSEIVIEGISSPEDERPEGPFGEWHGYYASSSRLVSTIKVTSLMYRNDPIILGVPSLKPSVAPLVFSSMLREAVVLEQLEKAGVPDVKAIRFHDAAAETMLSIIAIRQRYAGHSRQAARVLAQCGAGAYMGRYTIVVDDDIDIYDNDEVLWALGTRSDPQNAIEILTHCLSGPLDPAIRPGPNKEKWFNSRAIIDACKPWDWRSEFPVAVETPQELLREVKRKFGDQLHSP
ncbi:MAG: UbiD family decarboxylase, partial [Candidatus Tectomicrobia bacterium]|nr:UbiD family decarboxylase [Candidatus Tectomicrobia bacterium]